MLRRRVFFGILAPVLLAGVQFPSLDGENLLGNKVALPRIAEGRPAVFVIGFTHASQSQTKAWSARLSPTTPTYSVAVLQDVPRLVRGMAVSGIKSGVPQSQRDHFILVFKGEKELKEASGFNPSQPNDAYILLVDSAGAIQWQFHGALTDSAEAELRSKLAALQPHL